MSLVTVLEALSNEIRSMSQAAGDLQPILSSACTASDADPAFRIKAQHCDILTQKLDAVGIFLSDLSRTVPEACEVDAQAITRKIRLSELARTLACLPVADDTEPVSEIELF